MNTIPYVLSVGNKVVVQEINAIGETIGNLWSAIEFPYPRALWPHTWITLLAFTSIT